MEAKRKEPRKSLRIKVISMGNAEVGKYLQREKNSEKADLAVQKTALQEEVMHLFKQQQQQQQQQQQTTRRRTGRSPLMIIHPSPSGCAPRNSYKK